MTRLCVNGQWRELEAAPNRTLLSVLRDDLRLTGTKQGCTVGVCGLCSVLLDGQLWSSCLTLASAIDGAQVTTIEGIQRPELQQAFIDHAGFQCGICTPGQIIAASALLSENARPSPGEIREWMTGNLCRCTGYVGILESIAAAAAGTQRSDQPQREDGPDKVNGTTKYAGDLVRPGMLFGKVLRSPYPHARIVKVDTSAAASLDGVHLVLTGQDIPAAARVGRNMRDMPVLARDKVRFVGEKVAAVAAETLEIAERAVGLIQVEYEELPSVLDPLEAMQPGAPVVHSPEAVQAWAAGDQVVPNYPNGASAPSWGATEAEVTAALASADLIYEHTFNTPRQHQSYLEPHTCLVELDQRGITHIWASNKAPLLLARYLKEGLGLQRDQLEIHMLPLGGDFGGKGSFMDIPLAYFLARACGRPVKMEMTFAEELAAANPRHASTIVVRSGVNRDGRVVARWVRGYFASGGYAAFKPSTDTTLPGFRRGARGPYEIPVHRAEMHMVYTNTVPSGHMRSPGEAQVAFAIEAHTELIARELGMDSVALRALNVPARASEVLHTAASAIGWHEPRPTGTGRGIALIEFSTSPGVYAGKLRVTSDGCVTIQTPIIEQGAGMLMVFRRIVADELGVPVQTVRIEQSISGIEEDRGVGGSRTTRLVGKLLIELSHRVQARLAELVAAEYGEPRTISFAEAASLISEPIVESHVLRATENDRATVFLAQAAEVSVDRETGSVLPRRIVTAQEVGRVIEPLLFKRQIEGGLLQGLGYALMEELVVREGRVQNLNLHEYKIPTQADLPVVETVLVGHDPRLGITPVGEGASAGVAPAIVNAVVDVVGPRPFDLPLHPETLSQITPVRL